MIIVDCRSFEGVAKPPSNGRDMPSACLQRSYYQHFIVVGYFCSISSATPSFISLVQRLIANYIFTYNLLRPHLIKFLWLRGRSLGAIFGLQAQEHSGLCD